MNELLDQDDLLEDSSLAENPLKMCSVQLEEE